MSRSGAGPRDAASGLPSHHGDASVRAYGHPQYVASLAEWGEPILLPASGTWLLARPIGATGLRDVMGPYPLTRSPDWASLCGDIAGLPDDMVSLILVTDPFANEAARHLRTCCDEVRPFTEHHVADLDVPLADRISRHHQRRSGKARRSVEVDVLERPVDHLDEWLALYENLSRRHGIRGLKAFSRRAFERQLQVPGVVAFRARSAKQTTGMALWYEAGDVAYGHLVALAEAGYADGSSYALDWVACEWFGGRCRWLDFGGAPRGDTKRGAGLDAYKRGWSTGTAGTWLCTLIRDRAAYADLVERIGGSDRGYFPAYRDGELL